MNDDTMVSDIRRAIETHQANHEAMKAAKLFPAFEKLAIEAMRAALRDELYHIFSKAYRSDVQATVQGK